MLARTKLATRASPISPPASSVGPMTNDSGIPSSSAPTAMAATLPFWSTSDGFRTHPPQRLRWLAPLAASRQLMVLSTSASDRKPPTVTNAPPLSNAFSISSTDYTAISTPPPKPVTAAIRQ